MPLVGAGLLACALIAAATAADASVVFQWGDDLLIQDDPRSYAWGKVPSEGRWFIAVWYEVFSPLSAKASLLAGILMWGVANTLLVRLVVGAPLDVRHLVLVPVVALNPSALTLLWWPVTTLPVLVALAVVAAVLVVTESSRWRPLYLFAGCALLMSAYQLAPLIILVAELTRSYVRIARVSGRDRRTAWAHGVRAVLAIVAGCTAGLLACYAANRLFFGHFGFTVAQWRLGSGPDSRMALMGETIAVASGWLVRASNGAFLLLVVLALGLLRRTERLLSGLAVGLMLAGFALPGFVAFAAGVPLPEGRGAVTLWFAVSLLAVAAVDGRTKAMAAAQHTVALLVGALLVCLAIGWKSRPNYQRLNAQAEINAAIVDRMAGDLARLQFTPRTVVAVGWPTPFVGLQDTLPWWPRLLLKSALFPGSATTMVLCPNPSACLREGESISVPSPRATFPNEGYLMRAGDTLYLSIGPAPASVR